MATVEMNCYLCVNGYKVGPLSEKEILRLYTQEKITKETKFMRAGMMEWITLSQSDISLEMQDA